VKDLKRSIQKSVGGSSSSVSVAGRSNVVSATNVGSEGSVRQASATQSNRIVQRNGKTVNESHTDEVVQD
jgi:hypothetical protein